MRPSGIVTKFQVDPNVSSDDDAKSVKSKQQAPIEIKKVAQESRTKEFDDENNKQTEKGKDKEMKEMAKQKRKDDKAKLKRINDQFDRKDKRNTQRFLVKHGLTAQEAKNYTQLGTAFDLKALDD